MNIVTAAQMRELDRRTVEEAETKSEVLMERAGHGVADTVRRIAEVSGFFSPVVHLIAGRGNNGGDAFVAARLLKESGLTVDVWLAGTAKQITGDAFLHLNRLKSAQIKVEELPTIEDWQDAVRNPLFAEIIVDGVLGTGIDGPARGPAAGAIEYIRSQSNDALIVSIDIPSGLNADTGRAEGAAVRADVTVTMGLPKRGLVVPEALDHVGSLEIIDIGIPPEFQQDLTLEEDLQFLNGQELKPLFPRRHRASHKGHYGHVLLIGGARGYAGAMALAGWAATRSGVGLVSMLVPEGIQATVAGAVVEAMVHGGAESPEGALVETAWELLRGRAADFSTILIGPGLTRNAESRRLVERLIAECDVPLVLDADALNALEGRPQLLRAARQPTVITPHPGEAGRLLDCPAERVQSDRRGAAVRLTAATGGVVVLKGAGTLVAQAGQPTCINLTGNPGMATGGAGDVLAGLLAGLRAQGFSGYDAARAAVFLHGKAGDLAAWRRCQVGLTAGDIADELPFALREISLR